MTKFYEHLKKYRVLYVLSALFVSMISVHIVYNARGIYADDGNFFQHYPLMYDSLFDYLKVRYNSWSSRISIEIVMFTLINKRILFSIVNSLFYVLLAYSFYLFFDKKSIIISLIAVCLLPFYHFTSVGLYTGSVHYTWPVALLMYGLISIKKIINNQKLNVFEVILQFLCFIFVIFVEICAVLFLVFMVVAFVYNYIKNKKISINILISSVISIAGLVFILTAPGNANRSVLEYKYFPEYAGFNIVQKLTYGLVFVANANSLFPCAANIVFGILLFVLAIKNKDILAKIFAAIPLVFQPLFFIVFIVTKSFNKNLSFEFLTRANGLTFDNPLLYILCVYAVVVSLSTMLAIFKMFSGKERILYLICYVLVVGMIGSFGLNASISFYADYRPTIYSGFVLMIIAQHMIYSNADKLKLKSKK